MSTQSVARQYAKALFVVADRNARTAAVGSDLAEIVALVSGHVELERFFASPVVLPRRKREVVDAILAASVGGTAEVQRLLTLLADRDRMEALTGIETEYRTLLMEAGRAVEADVVTAMPIADEHLAALGTTLGRATGRTVTVNGRVDPEILGGVVARVGSLVFDGSVAGQLRRLRQRVTTGV